MIDPDFMALRDGLVAELSKLIKWGYFEEETTHIFQVRGKSSKGFVCRLMFEDTYAAIDFRGLDDFEHPLRTFSYCDPRWFRPEVIAEEIEIIGAYVLDGIEDGLGPIRSLPPRGR